MTSCSATSWSILRFRATYTLFTISESRAIFHANDTERQAQQVAENPRRQRVSGETPLENAHLNSSRVEKTTRSREALKQSEGNVKTATTNIFFVFNHVTKFCYVTRVRHAGGHPFSQIWLPRTRVWALVWLFGILCWSYRSSKDEIS